MCAIHATWQPLMNLHRLMFVRMKRHLWKLNDIMVDIEVPACCYTKMELFNEAHVVCMSISFVFDELYAKTRVRNVLLPKGPHRSVLPVAALKPVLSCS